MKKNSALALFSVVLPQKYLQGYFNHLLGMMPRLVSLTATGSVTLTLFMAGVASSQPLSPGSQYLQQQSEVDVPLCYLQTVDGRMIDLHELCDKIPANSTVPASQISGSKFQGGSDAESYRPRSREH